MITAVIKRLLRPMIQRLAAVPAVRRMGHRVLAPFPRARAWLIRLVQAGKYRPQAADYRIEGYGERQQRLTNGLEQRWKYGPNE